TKTRYALRLKPDHSIGAGHEELDADTPWADVAPGFRDTLGRVTGILDDLRLHSGTETPQSVQTVFTPRTLAAHLKDTFHAAAEANGITLRLALSQQSDMLIRSDYGRIYIALSKLIHNAIVHSQGSETVLSVLMTRASETAWTVTWQVSDNGLGISPEAQSAMCRPFDADTGGLTGANVGLGLYTARQAMRLMGGDLTLRTTNDAGSTGASFVLHHPARPARPASYIKLEPQPVTESKVRYPDKTVLLIEDNRIVGEITAARLRRLVGTTIWAETGTEGLQAFHANDPDLILVDQLLPGMLGSEVVREIRATNTSVPIVGITASTLGSECAELEAAGANYALEKPLSLPQLEKIAGEFFD
ncbi:response regulator, partial [Seohaeicola zhoushanensis]|uniref:response regulator n=1 Tax=Seohaeicola zhoushanensis TaxID=1569283 RepID=UPI001673AD1D